MISKQEIGEKNGKLCMVEVDMATGRCYYYPIRARMEIELTPNSPTMFLPDPYLYVDRENEI